ncbi:MAG: class I SAM-dependent methyltransferase [Saprospiraceae bacterium]
MDKNSTQRFSQKVETYIKYRPGYPSTLIDFFSNKIQGTKDAIIADIGSGTGILTEPFLKNGNVVFGIEPNKEMREGGEQFLENYPKFQSISGTAEATNLPSSSVDFIMAGQAFHWFDVEKSKVEFERILKKNGQVLLIWNTRDDVRSHFMKEYNQYLLTYSTDYQLIMHRRLERETFSKFYGNQEIKKIELENYQIFDLDGLIGRYMSCSYSFDANHSKHKEAMQELEKIFKKHEENNRVKMWYKTEVYFGKLN